MKYLYYVIWKIVNKYKVKYIYIYSQNFKQLLFKYINYKTVIISKYDVNKLYILKYPMIFNK